MRIWSVHPRYLDRQGLLACWRESLLAQKVLAGLTTGYRHHPQLTRFRATPEPAGAIGGYLSALADDADRRGYHFDRGRIGVPAGEIGGSMPVTEGQLAYEWVHLMAKLRVRTPDLARQWAEVNRPLPHPLFCVVPGEIEPWEVVREPA